MEVETPFGSLYYQARWQEHMRTEQEQTEGYSPVCSVLFFLLSADANI